MSILGQEQTFSAKPMSALPPIADMDQHAHDVRFVPKADITLARDKRYQISGIDSSARRAHCR